jgi:hypothetical protein
VLLHSIFIFDGVSLTREHASKIGGQCAAVYFWAKANGCPAGVEAVAPANSSSGWVKAAVGCESPNISARRGSIPLRMTLRYRLLMLHRGKIGGDSRTIAAIGRG